MTSHAAGTASDAAPAPDLAHLADPDDLADRALGLMAALPLALIVALTFADVFARYLFARPIRGSVEIIQYAMALVIFAALPLVTRHRGHVTVSLIDNLVHGAARRVKQVVCDALSVVALALISWRLWAQGASDTAGSTRSIVLGLPQAPLAYALCAFAAVSTALMLVLLWRSLRGRNV